MPTPPSIRELVEFGLSSVPESQVVEVRLRDLLFVNQAIGEMIRFFHQPENFKEVESVRSFLGEVGNGGAYEVLHTAYYSKLRSMLPAEVTHSIEEGTFDHPAPPAYYGPAA